MNLYWPAAALLLLCSANPVLAQGYTSSDLGEQKHRDFVGKPCLESTGEAQPLVSNPRILNHSVILNNHCSERIKVKVCYHRTDDCTDVEVPPRSRKQQIIGVLPAMQQFRYDVREQFDAGQNF